MSAVTGSRPTMLSLIGVLVLGWSLSGGGVAALEDQKEPDATPTADNQTVGEAEPAGEEEKPLTNTLKWTTASEVDNFGFDIYRGVQEEGPFERITKEPIPGAGTTDEPQKYVYVDDTNDQSKGYYYYIESISMAGVRERFSPVAFVRAKRPVENDEAQKPEQSEGAEEDEQ